MTVLFGFWGGEIFPKRFSPFCPILCHLLPPLLHHNGGDERPPSPSPRSCPEVGYLRAKIFAGPTFFLRKSHPFPLYIVRRARRRRPKAVSSLWYPFREKRSLDGDGKGGGMVYARTTRPLNLAPGGRFRFRQKSGQAKTILFRIFGELPEVAV